MKINLFFLNKYSWDFCKILLISKALEKLIQTMFANFLIAFIKKRTSEIHPLLFAVMCPSFFIYKCSIGLLCWFFLNIFFLITPFYFSSRKYKISELYKDTSVRFDQGLEDENHCRLSPSYSLHLISNNDYSTNLFLFTLKWNYLLKHTH